MKSVTALLMYSLMYPLMYPRIDQSESFVVCIPWAVFVRMLQYIFTGTFRRLTLKWASKGVVVIANTAVLTDCNKIKRIQENSFRMVR